MEQGLLETFASHLWRHSILALSLATADAHVILLHLGNSLGWFTFPYPSQGHRLRLWMSSARTSTPSAGFCRHSALIQLHDALNILTRVPQEFQEACTLIRLLLCTSNRFTGGNRWSPEKSMLGVICGHVHGLSDIAFRRADGANESSFCGAPRSLLVRMFAPCSDIQEPLSSALAACRCMLSVFDSRGRTSYAKAEAMIWNHARKILFAVYSQESLWSHMWLLVCTYQVLPANMLDISRLRWFNPFLLKDKKCLGQDPVRFLILICDSTELSTQS